MTRTATILAWLALLVGVPQVLLGLLGLYTGGWRILFFAGLIVAPFVPLLARRLLRQRGAPPRATAVATILLALAAMALSAWTYLDVVRAFGDD